MTQAEFLELIEAQIAFAQMIPSSAQQVLDAIAIGLAAYKLKQGINSSSELAS